MIDFTYVNRVGTMPLEVDFTDASTGTYTYRKWVFGDGESVDGNLTSVSHTYKTPGVYSVALIAGNATEHDQLLKEDIIYVNESIEDSRLMIAESQSKTGAYWKLYIDLNGKLLFETQDSKRITEEKIALVNRWMFIEYHAEEDRFYVGSYALGRRHKKHKQPEHSQAITPETIGSFKIATNSSYTIDDLKLWETDNNLYEYFNSLRGRAGYLDPVGG
jgi:PKD repeat protein